MKVIDVSKLPIEEVEKIIPRKLKILNMYSEKMVVHGKTVYILSTLKVEDTESGEVYLIKIGDEVVGTNTPAYWLIANRAI